MMEVRVVRYMANDGVVFETEKLCVSHEFQNALDNGQIQMLDIMELPTETVDDAVFVNLLSKDAVKVFLDYIRVNHGELVSTMYPQQPGRWAFDFTNTCSWMRFEDLIYGLVRSEISHRNIIGWVADLSEASQIFDDWKEVCREALA